MVSALSGVPYPFRRGRKIDAASLYTSVGIPYVLLHLTHILFLIERFSTTGLQCKETWEKALTEE